MQYRDFNIIISSSFEECKDKWIKLEEEGYSYPFQKYDWIKCWYDKIGVFENIIPQITLIIKNEIIIALMPLCIERTGHWRSISWMGGIITDYNSVLLNRNIQDYHIDFCKIITKIGRLNKCSYIDLIKNPAFINSIKNPIINSKFIPEMYSSHGMKVPVSFDIFSKERFSSKSRYNLRRAENLLEKDSDLKYVVSTEHNERMLITNKMIEHKCNKYDLSGKRNIFKLKGYADFYLELCHNKMVTVSALYYKNYFIATHWGLIWRNIFYYLMPTYEPGEITRYSPGKILLKNIVIDCIAQGIDKIDFSIGDEIYKDEWCNETMQMYYYFKGLNTTGKLIEHFLRFYKYFKRTSVFSIINKIKITFFNRG